MTNEEAIKILTEISDYEAEALDLAIEALEKQQRDCKICIHSDKGKCAGTEECHECMWDSKYEQQPCEDCISRQAVNVLVDELARAISDERCFISRGRNTATIMQDILDLPSVTPSYNSIKTELKDCISRKDAVRIASINSMPVDECVKMIKALPPVTPQQIRWIPVSESLPEEDGEYLLFGKVTDEDKNCIFVGEYYAWLEKFGIWQEQFDIGTRCLSSDFYEYESVIAWMPLPQPYAESEE